MIKMHWGITLLLGFMVSGLPLAAQSGFEREIIDRAEIEKLMWQYARALDTENADAYVEPNAYRYFFFVNGVRVPDPAAREFSFERTNVDSLVEVTGAAEDFEV